MSDGKKIVPRCRHFGECGGCKYQDVSYEDELKAKEEGVRALFAPHPLLPIIGADPIWESRNKMEFTFTQDKKGQKFLGLFLKSGRGKVFNIEECPISPPWFIEARSRVYRWWEESGLHAYNPRKDEGSLRLLTLRDAQKGKRRLLMITCSGRPEYALKKEDLNALVKEFSEDNLSLFLRIQQTKKGSPTQFFEMHLGGPDGLEEILQMEPPLHFAISPASFFQPHTPMAEKLYRLAKEWISPLEGKVVYDLFSGTATLSQVIAAAGAKEVIAVEIMPEAIVDAKVNIRKNGISNIQLIEGDVFKVLEQKSGELPKADVIVIDPPRPGLGEKAASFISKMHVKEVLYISCNPTTQAQDLIFFQNEGYIVEKIQPFDQFPRTAHVENILLMRYPGEILNS